MEEETMVDAALLKAFDRETRLMSARTTLAVVMEYIDPPADCKVNEEYTLEIPLEARFGLMHILRQIDEALDENLDAFCYCHEKKQQAASCGTTRAVGPRVQEWRNQKISA